MGCRLGDSINAYVSCPTLATKHRKLALRHIMACGRACGTWQWTTQCLVACYIDTKCNVRYTRVQSCGSNRAGFQSCAGVTRSFDRGLPTARRQDTSGNLSRWCRGTVLLEAASRWQPWMQLSSSLAELREQIKDAAGSAVR